MLSALPSIPFLSPTLPLYCIPLVPELDREMKIWVRVSKRSSVLLFLSVEIPGEKPDKGNKAEILETWDTGVGRSNSDSRKLYDAGWTGKDFRLWSLTRRNSDLHRAQKGRMPAPRHSAWWELQDKAETRKSPFPVEGYYRSFLMSPMRKQESKKRKKK